jgi:hypothetical protein
VYLTATRQLAVFLRSIGKQRAQPVQLLRPGFGPFGEHDARAARQRWLRWHPRDSLSSTLFSEGLWKHDLYGNPRRGIA